MSIWYRKSCYCIIMSLKNKINLISFYIDCSNYIIYTSYINIFPISWKSDWGIWVTCFVWFCCFLASWIPYFNCWIISSWTYKLIIYINRIYYSSMTYVLTNSFKSVHVPLKQFTFSILIIFCTTWIYKLWILFLIVIFVPFYL